MKVVVITSDITGRKRAAEALRERENAYRTLSENLPGIVYRVFMRENNRMEFFNSMLETMTGYRAEELSSGEVCSIEPMILSADRASVLATVSRAILDKQPFKVEYRLREKGGEIRHFVERGRPVYGADGKPLHIDGVIFDITERKRTEELLKKSEQEKLAILEATLEGIGFLDTNMRILWANKTSGEMTGLTPEQMAGRHCYEIVAQRSEPCMGCPAMKTLQTGKSEEVEISSSTGRTRLHRSYPVRIPNGEIEGIVTTTIDITERKQIEEELRRSRDELEMRVRERTAKLFEANQDLQRATELLERLFSNTNVMIAYMDKDFTFLRVNRTWLEDDGRGPEFLVGKNLFELFPNADKKDFMKVVETGEPNSGYEKPFIHPEHPERGVTYWDWHLQPVKGPDDKVTGVVLSLVNVTERNLAERKLRESEGRLRDLSSQLMEAQENERKRIARELHDGLGQSLTGIKYKIESILQKIGPKKRKTEAESLESVIPMIQECVREIHRIKTDLRPSALELGILATVNWLCREFEGTFSGIRIEKQIDVQEAEVHESLKMAIYRILQEALNNIAKHSQANVVHLALRSTDQAIEFSIKDNGRGFDLQEARSMNGSRWGMGLSSMKERTEHLGGSFCIESAKGKGTLIRAIWPLGDR